MRKMTVLLAAVAALASTSAFAGVTGPRVEAIVGWDNVRVDIDDFGDGSRSGLVYGLGLGYDFGVGANVSVGLDAEITDSTADLKMTDGADRARVAAGRDLYVGGRITTAVSDKLNLYAKAGYTNARIKASATVNGVTVKDAANGDGIRGGLGLQYLVGTNAYMGAEYRYSNYEGDFSRHQVVATIGYRF